MTKSARDERRSPPRQLQGADPQSGPPRISTLSPLSCTAATSNARKQTNKGRGRGGGVRKAGNAPPMGEPRPTGALSRHILIIVQNSDLVLLHWHPSCGD